MALDVYFGSLTRYYSGDWENVAEKVARERGVQYRMTRTPPKDTLRDAARIRPVVLAWRRKLGEALSGKVDAALDWDESADASYFTDRPGWDGFGSLVLWAAYSEHPALRRPQSLPEAWDDDAALVRSNAANFKSRYGHLVRNIELWLPCGFAVSFEAEDAAGRKTVIGSVMTLRRQLADLNDATWKAKAHDIASWRGAPPGEEADLEARAKFAFSVFTSLVEQAAAAKLPMKLDY